MAHEASPQILAWFLLLSAENLNCKAFKFQNHKKYYGVRQYLKSKKWSSSRKNEKFISLRYPIYMGIAPLEDSRETRRGWKGVGEVRDVVRR